ncbi:MAG: hypothetical protein ACK55Z_11100, partial [bacterium]
AGGVYTQPLWYINSMAEDFKVSVRVHTPWTPAQHATDNHHVEAVVHPLLPAVPEPHHDSSFPCPPREWSAGAGGHSRGRGRQGPPL